MEHIFEMIKSLNINLYLRPFSIAIYGMFTLRQKIVQNLLIFVYLFFPENNTVDSR